jgi:hypothetical protein
MFYRVIILLALVLPAGACGRKPTGLAIPEDAAADAYPQVYPRPLPGEAAAVAPESDMVSKYKARPEQALQ